MTLLPDLLSSDKNYFHISEASQIAQVPSHTLRYWEHALKLLRPTRRESGHRRYTRKDLELILKIKDLRYNKRYTLAGTKKFLLEESRKGVEQLKLQMPEGHPAIETLKEAKKELKNLLEELGSN